jgi:hypothetical protein
LKLIRKHFLLIVVSLSVLLYLVSLIDRFPHLDDAWLAEHSYWYAKDGVAKSTLMTGFAGSEDRLLLHHKFFTLQGALVIGLLGFNLSILKSVALLYFVLFVFLFWRFLDRVNFRFDNKTKLLAIWMIFFNPLVFEFSFVFRPETMLMTFGFLSYFFIYNSLLPDISVRKSNWYSVLAGLLAGLSMFTHLNGIVFASAGFLLFLFRWKPIQLLVFTMAVLSAGLGYFYDFNTLNDFTLWNSQLTFVPTTEGGSPTFIIQLFLNVINEHRRYFHSPKEIIFTVLLFSAILLNIRNLISKQRILLLYTLFLVITLAAFALNKTSKYLIMLLPFFVPMIIQTLIDLQESNKVKSSKNILSGRLLVTLIVFFGFISSMYNVSISLKKIDTSLNANVTTRFAHDNAKNLRVLAPMEFIFDEISNYKSIVSLMSYGERMKIDSGLKEENLIRCAGNENIDILYITDYYKNKFGLIKFSKGNISGEFTCVYAASGLMVWEKTTLLNNEVSILNTVNPLILNYKKGIFQYRSSFD